MHNLTIIYSIMGIHCLLLLGQIYKNSLFIEQLFIKQKYEKQYALLKQELNELECQLHTLQDLQSVRNYAKNNLHMKTISTTQMKALPHDSTPLSH